MRTRPVYEIISSIEVLKRAGVTQRMDLLQECRSALLEQQVHIARLESEIALFVQPRA